ncbi:hypothetical protein QN277_005712 [Acacia crassicarpa]|uniref:Major facilitator superfamily (MFS) profile domain-containing protein n=1 Tax=Acacia crassicarpa TaxID=499986 RepID=A0AAE1MA25_9FABA|nr:hypothetical protein QN277_005712 [Acacia crassicarpa]
MTEPTQILGGGEIQLASSENMENPTGIPETELNAYTEESLGNFGIMQFFQSLLVAISMVFDAQQVFVAAFTDARPMWHCKATCSRRNSDICKLPRSTWDWNGPSSMTIISQWSLECANPFLTSLPQSVFFMGCLFAGFLITPLADSYLGRKKMLSLCCLTMSISSSLIIFSPNLWMYCAFKFIIGFCRSSVSTCSTVLLVERVRKEWRFTVGVIGYLMYALGFLSLPAIAYVYRDSSWKPIYLWISIPAICYSVIAYIFVTESPRWLLMRGKRRGSGGTLTPSQLTEFANMRASNFNWYPSFRNIFMTSWALKRLVAVTVLAFGIGMMYFGLPLSVGNLGVNMYLSFVFYALLDIPASIATYVLDKCRRKPSLLAFSIVCGTSCLTCAVIGDELHIVKLVLALVSFFCVGTCFDILLLYIVELFPTSVRNTATAMARQAMNFGAMFSPLLVSLGRKNDFFSYGIFGLIILCTTSSLLCLPETKGMVLCDTMDEQERMGRTAL